MTTFATLIAKLSHLVSVFLYYLSNHGEDPHNPFLLVSSGRRLVKQLKVLNPLKHFAYHIPVIGVLSFYVCK